jgi:plastocyanin
MKQMVALYLGLPFAALIGLMPPAHSEEVRDFYIKTVHLDGNTSIKGDADHKPEAFPTAPLPDGGGLVLSKPDADGKWRIRAFTFERSQIVVKAGEPIRLHFVGVQGMNHHIHLEGEGVDEKFALPPGTMHTVELKPEKAGIIEIECYNHQPSMQGEIVVLPQ